MLLVSLWVKIAPFGSITNIETVYHGADGLWIHGWASGNFLGSVHGEFTGQQKNVSRSMLLLFETMQIAPDCSNNHKQVVHHDRYGSGSLVQVADAGAVTGKDKNIPLNIIDVSMDEK